MDPITAMIIMALGGAISGGTQLGFGLADRAKGRRLEDQAGDRPDYAIPESVDKAIQMYQQMASGGLPGEGAMKQDIQGQTAQSVGRAGQLADSPVAALTAMGAAQQREASALRDLQVRASQYQAQARQNYAQSVGQRAGYEQEQWRQNQLMPWEIQMNRAMQFQTGGAGNIMGGADALGSTMAQAGGALGTWGMYENMYPDWGGSQGAEFSQGINPASWGNVPPQGNNPNANYYG